MATAAETAAYKRSVDQLTLAATGQAADLIRETANPNPEIVRDRLKAALPTLLEPYTIASSELSAAWYEELRRDAVGGNFLAKTVESISTDLTDGIVRYAVTPLFFESTASVLALMAAGVQKAIANSGRETTIQNVSRDPSRVRYARVPSPGCCAFCAVLASRGAEYRDAGSATLPVGRGVEPRPAFSKTTGRYIGRRGGGRKATGSRSLGTPGFHDFCRCAAVAIWPGQELPYDRQQYLDMYNSVPYGSIDEIAAEIRKKYEIR